MRLGTRRSALALAQARLVADMLGGCEIVEISTRGDRGADAVGGDKSRWVAELELALASGEIDLAVHSAKDVPARLADGLALLAAPTRAGSEDALCGAGGLTQLESGARVGTSSLRRVAQLRAERDDLDVVPLRGNVDTRLRKLAAGEGGVRAVVLARAGLQRLGRQAEIGALLDPQRFVPAPGQGTLALEGRSGDAHALRAAQAIGDPSALACLRCERALARELEADCDSALGAHSEPAGGGLLRLRGWVGMRDGSAWVSDERLGAADDPEALGREVAERMRAAGAGEIMRDGAGVGA